MDLNELRDEILHEDITPKLVSEFDDMKQKLTKVKDKNSKLKKENKRLDKELKAKEEDLKQTLKKLRNKQINLNRKQILTLGNGIKELKELQKVQEENQKQYQSDCQVLMNKLQKKNVQVKELEEKIEKQRVKIENTNIKVKDMEKTVTHIHMQDTAQKKEISELKKTKEKQNQQIVKTTATLEYRTKYVAKLLKVSKFFQSRSRDLEKKLEENNVEKTNLQMKINTATTELKEKSSSTSKQISDLEKTLQMMHEENERRGKLKGSESSMKETQTETSSLKIDENAIKMEYSIKKDELELSYLRILRNRNQQMNSRGAIIEELQDEIKNLKSVVQNLQKELKKLITDNMINRV